jgi:hypothetical protein
MYENKSKIWFSIQLLRFAYDGRVRVQVTLRYDLAILTSDFRPRDNP